MKPSITTRERVMPFLHLKISSPSLSTTQRQHLQTGLTTLMAEILRKQAKLTVVAIDLVAPEQWSVGGQALAADAWAAELEVAITAGTNTADECTRFIDAAHALLRSVWPTAPSAPLYIVLRELPASHWGYDGLTQAARRQTPDHPAPRTLKAISGLPPAQAPVAQGSALILIDFQREYLDGLLPLPGIQQAMAQAGRLMTAAEAAGIPIIHVHQQSPSPSAVLFNAQGQGSAGVEQLPIAAHHHRIVKTWPSSFKDTELSALLTSLDTTHLVLAGCMTHHCVDSTAREAMHLGWSVTVVSDACTTRDLQGLDGQVLPACQVHLHSLSALADRHAEVFTTDDVTRRWESTKRAIL